ncbi:MAG: ADP-ribosylglycohydrolase family protein [Chloroflexota bacterium]|nr:ADP-ribosylglycohydrolase family protein [Chloroflexota bacterium]
MASRRPTENQFLGVLLGLAIGDALGMPVSGLSAAQIAEQYGSISTYQPRRLDDGTEIAAGEITDETETTLCIVESLTTNDGLIEPANIGARLSFLSATESRRWLSPATLAGIARASERDGLVTASDEEEVDITALVRGVPAGLLHVFGAFDADTLRGDAALLTRLTHGGRRQAELSAAVAMATRVAVVDADRPDSWGETINDFTTDAALRRKLAAADELATAPVDAAEGIIAAAIQAASTAAHFEDAVFALVNRGGPADTAGALAGALAGARFGASGIPQGLIDGLGARIYLSLAAPWLYRTMQRRAGTVIDLRPL